MFRGLWRRRIRWVPITGFACLSLLTPQARAGDPSCTSSPYTQAVVPGAPVMYQQAGYRPGCAPPCAAPCAPPCAPPIVITAPPATTEPKKEATEPKKETTEPKKDMTEAPVTPPTDQLAQAPESGAELGGGGGEIASSNVGYIDSAIPRTQVRFRFDAYGRDFAPDKAEFIYPKCGCFATLPPGNPLRDPKASGPPLMEKAIDSFQEYRTYLEGALSDRFSAFIEVPIRSINPEVNSDQAGLGDIEAGFKYAFIADCNRYLTFQTRIYTPTGDGDKGLGTNHVSVEPGLLVYQGLGDRARLEGELRYWIPVGGSDFQGQVVRTGIGLSYDVWQSCDKKQAFAPVVEFVSWTILNGKYLDTATSVVREAGGQEIINAKVGLRYSTQHFSIYGGYGRAITGDEWYREVARLEMKFMY